MKRRYSRTKYSNIGITTAAACLMILSGTAILSFQKVIHPGTRMIGIAESLPTSRTSTAAYIMKFAKEPSDKIIYRILWPSFATVEHIFPRACGGIDDMSNYGGACALANSDLGCDLLYDKVKRAPKTPIYCQKQVDRLIELAKQGVFEIHYIDTKYIEEYKNTVYEESQGLINLDISKLYE